MIAQQCRIESVRIQRRPLSPALAHLLTRPFTALIKAQGLVIGQLRSKVCGKVSLKVPSTVTLLGALMFTGALRAEPVWHCSRMPMTEVAAQSREEPGDIFNLAEQGALEDVIRISLRDLIDVYSGVSVRLSGVTLSACFLPVNEFEATQALKALGLSEAVFSALARTSAIAANHLYRVTDQAAMRSCIAHHHPAVGYLNQAQITPQLGPCF